VNSDPTQVLLGSSPESDPDGTQRERLFVLLYDELHACAARMMRRERPGHTLRPTALVHEAYLRLIDQSRVDWGDRARFGRIAARAMRQFLVEHARRRYALMRGGKAAPVLLVTVVVSTPDRAIELLEIDDALSALRAVDERAAAVVEIRIFAGMTLEEAAAVHGVSRRTVDGDWAFARRWLSRAIG
jgi:RNA polymerase sigma factor (TIGR02999 family)